MNTPRLCIMFGTGITIDLVHWTDSSRLVIPSTILGEDDLILRYPYLSRLNSELAHLGEPERVQAICHQLRQNIRRQLEYPSNPPSNEPIGRRYAEDNDPELQFRELIWHRMLKVDRWMRQITTTERFRRWPWITTIRRIQKQFRCGYMSYNYDLVPQHLLTGGRAQTDVRTVFEDRGFELFDGRRMPRVVNIHGSIAFGSPAATSGINGQQRINMFANDFWIKWQYPPDQHAMPFPIDLIPPGMVSAEAYNFRYADIYKMATRLVSCASAYCAIGFRFGEADLEEFLEMADPSLQSKTIVHVATQRNDQAAARFRGCGAKYVFVDALKNVHYQLPCVPGSISHALSTSGKCREV